MENSSGEIKLTSRSKNYLILAGALLFTGVLINGALGTSMSVVTTVAMLIFIAPLLWGGRGTDDNELVSKVLMGIFTYLNIVRPVLNANLDLANSVAVILPSLAVTLLILGVVLVISRTNYLSVETLIGHLESILLLGAVLSIVSTAFFKNQLELLNLVIAIIAIFVFAGYLLHVMSAPVATQKRELL